MREYSLILCKAHTHAVTKLTAEVSHMHACAAACLPARTLTVAIRTYYKQACSHAKERLGTTLTSALYFNEPLVITRLCSSYRTSLVPRPPTGPPSSVRNARAQFNAGVEKRREKAWTNFTRM